jgi:CheY-like chemotaxis protein
MDSCSGSERMCDAITVQKRGDIDIRKADLLCAEMILIVDDDEDILKLAAEILDTLGYDVITARTGWEALGILQNNSRISVLFTDLQMPGMGGEELAEIAVASRPDLRVIFASAPRGQMQRCRFSQSPTKPPIWFGCCPRSRDLEVLTFGCLRRSRVLDNRTYRVGR